MGGYAVAAHGHVRATGDIDFWVAPTPENAQRVIKALADFGFRFPNLTAEDFLNEDNVVQLGYPPLRIDLMTAASGLTFEEAYARKQVIRIDDLPINLVSLADLRKNKQASGRSKDLGQSA